MQNLKRLLIIVTAIFMGKILFAASMDFTRPVIDQTQTLSQQEIKTLSDELWQWHKQGLMQGAVIVVKTTNGEDIFDYGMNIFERWQLGNKESNNGLLMIVAKDERKIRIITGYGLEGVLPDISIKRIIDQDITPQFKKNAFFTGIKNGLTTIVNQIKADPETLADILAADEAMQDEAEMQSVIGEIFSVGVIIFSIVLNLILRSISSLKEKGRKRFFISLSSVVGLVVFIAFTYGVSLVILIPPAVMALIIGTAIANKGQRGSDSNYNSFPRDRDSFSRAGSEDSYRGGGGSSGGGGAGGSW